ncbi:MAG TPA: sugar phosphate isomerase/epimerase family protein [Thermomicrobiales bacterium]|nr:sugar phosphate isomerase/epimerase family protein [Thermomicrobiales bacterium]
MVWRLSGFADEIDPDPSVQIATLQSEEMTHLELRGAWDKNVLRLSDRELDQLATMLREAEIGVSSIASPIGKVAINEDFSPHLADFQRALAIARQLDAPFVRIFSFYLPAGDDPARHRDEVLERVGTLVRETEGTGLTLLHENEKGIYGDTPERCHDLLRTIDSPALRVAWDPANFVQVGARPFTEGYALLRPFIAYLHVKDADMKSGEITVAGAGDGEWRETLAALRDDRFDGFCSLEPHLAMAGHAGGFSGPDLFRKAAGAFQRLLREQGIAWA